MAYLSKISPKTKYETLNIISANEPSNSLQFYKTTIPSSCCQDFYTIKIKDLSGIAISHNGNKKRLCKF